MRRTIDVGYVNGVPRAETHCCTIAGNPKPVSSPYPIWCSRVILVLVWRPSWSAVPAVLIAMVGDGSPPRSLRHSVGTGMLVRSIELTMIPWGLSSERRLPLRGRLLIVPPPNLLGRHRAAVVKNTPRGVFPGRLFGFLSELPGLQRGALWGSELRPARRRGSAASVARPARLTRRSSQTHGRTG